MNTRILQITQRKKQYLPLLLLADEQESMIDRYLERGEMFALEDNGLKAICVVTDEGNGICELKNIAVIPEAQRKGYGKKLIGYQTIIRKNIPQCLSVQVMFPPQPNFIKAADSNTPTALKTFSQTTTIIK